MHCRAQDRACEAFYARKASVKMKKVKKKIKKNSNIVP